MSPGAAATFTVSNPSPQTAGTAFNVTITALDAYGNTATGYTGAQDRHLRGPVQLAEQDRPDLPGSVTFASGVGTASITLVDAQTTTLPATQGATTGTSGTFTVNGTGTVSDVHRVRPRARQTAGTAFNVTITAVDAVRQHGTTGYIGCEGR